MRVSCFPQRKKQSAAARFSAPAGLAAALLFCVSASAQGQAQKSENTPANPAASWRVECTSDGKTLDCRAIQQAVQGQGSNRQVAAIMSIRVPAETRKPVLMLQLPLGIKLADPVTIQVDGGAAEKFEVQTCTQGGCFVGSPVSDKLLAAMRGGEAVRIAYNNMSQQSVTIALSLSGFSLAYDKVK